jgi:hypothetical protein
MPGWLDRGAAALRAAMRSATFRSALRIAGIALLLVGLQSLLFQRSIQSREAEARDNLERLRQEVVDTRLIDGALQALRDYWQLVADEARKRQALALRDAVHAGYRDDMRGTVEEFVRRVRELEATTATEREALAELRQRVSVLEQVYSDHYGPLVDRGSAWYFQPAASLQPGQAGARQALALNHALYLMLVRDQAAANAILDELARNARSERFRSRVQHAQSRLQFEAYVLEPDPQYLGQSLQLARQSVASDADHTAAKLFLEFLLGVDRSARQLDTAPVQGQGAGEGEAERGAIATDAKEY